MNAPRTAITTTILRIALLLATASVVVAESQGQPRSGDQAIPGLDHIPIAVANLESAAERYRALGFVLKPGRPHENGIRNLHAKFRDGTELELISTTSSTPSDRIDRALFGPGNAVIWLTTRKCPGGSERP